MARPVECLDGGANHCLDMAGQPSRPSSVCVSCCKFPGPPVCRPSSPGKGEDQGVKSDKPTKPATELQTRTPRSSASPSQLCACPPACTSKVCFRSNDTTLAPPAQIRSAHACPAQPHAEPSHDLHRRFPRPTLSSQEAFTVAIQALQLAATLGILGASTAAHRPLPPPWLEFRASSWGIMIAGAAAVAATGGGVLLSAAMAGLEGDGVGGWPASQCQTALFRNGLAGAVARRTCAHARPRAPMQGSGFSADNGLAGAVI